MLVRVESELECALSAGGTGWGDGDLVIKTTINFR